MRILVLGEGTTDLGRCDNQGNLISEGVVPVLVRRLLSTNLGLPIEFHIKRMAKIRLFPRHIGRSSSGFANKLRIAAQLGGSKFDAIIAVVDRDGTPRNDRLQELNVGRESLRENNQPAAVGVAIEMIEAWLLADEIGLRTALGSNDIPTQPEPESLAARDESSENNPKGRLLILMREAMGSDSDVDNYADRCAVIANALRVEILERRCSNGFAPFARQVRELLPR